MSILTDTSMIFPFCYQK